MATLADALGERLTGVPNLSAWTFRDHVEALVEMAGSGRALGRALGVAESTVRGWRHGSTPRTGMRGFVVEMTREALVQTWRGWPHSLVTMNITGEVMVSSDVRRRTLNVGRFIPPRRIADALDSWRAGDDLAAARQIHEAVRRYYTRAAVITDVTKVDW